MGDPSLPRVFWRQKWEGANCTVITQGGGGAFIVGVRLGERGEVMVLGGGDVTCKLGWWQVAG